jgi:hypothetical protein
MGRMLPQALCRRREFAIAMPFYVPAYQNCHRAVSAPAKEPPTGSGWIHEIKHDGFRILARRNANGVRLYTRRRACGGVIICPNALVLLGPAGMSGCQIPAHTTTQ